MGKLESTTTQHVIGSASIKQNKLLMNYFWVR
jgi:hypothetical protein